MLTERVGVGAGKSIDNEFAIWMKPVLVGELIHAHPGNASRERLLYSILARNV